MDIHNLAKPADRPLRKDLIEAANHGEIVRPDESTERSVHVRGESQRTPRLSARPSTNGARLTIHRTCASALQTPTRVEAFESIEPP